MNKTYTLTLLASAVVTLFTACGETSETTSPSVTDTTTDNRFSVAEAPVQITAPMDINLTTLRNAIHQLKVLTTPVPSPARSWGSSSSNVSAGAQDSSYTRDCQVSGTYTVHSISSWDANNTFFSEDQNTSWFDKETVTTTYAECKNYYLGRPEDGNSTRFVMQDGVNVLHIFKGFDATSNKSTSTFETTQTYTVIEDNNFTSASSVRTFNVHDYSNKVVTGNYDPIVYLEGAYSTEHLIEGNISVIAHDINTIEILNTKELFSNFLVKTEGVHGDYDQMTQDGYHAKYDINATDETLTSATYFDNFVSHNTVVGDESRLKFNGTYGGLCLGGSITLTTTELFHIDEVNYLDGNDQTGSNVLPYTGQLKLVGNETATITFTDLNGNHTNAVMITPTIYEIYTGWNELAVSTCN